MEEPYGIFISYRRDGGESTAKILRDKLTELGYRVFFDVESLRSGDFNTKLYSVIDECSDFLLVLSPGALDRCWDEDDWVRLEVERALAKGKNVIPILLRGFRFPDKLPESIDSLRFKNGIESNYQFFDAFIEKLLTFLSCQPGRKRKKFRWLAAVAGAAICALAIAGALFLRGGERPYPGTEREKNLTRDLLYYVQVNLLQLEQAAEYLDRSYLACEEYLTHAGADRSALLAQLQTDRRFLNQLELDGAAMSESLRTDLMDSPFSLADAQAMHDYLKEFRDSSVDNLFYMEFLTDPDSYIDQTVREKTLDSYQEILTEEMKMVAYSTNGLLLPITNSGAIDEFMHKFLPQLYYIPLQASVWSGDQASLESAEDKSWNAIQKIMDRITVQLGESNAALMREKAELVQKLIGEGASEEEAERIVASLMGKSDLVSEKEAALQELRKELEESLNEARTKFAPAPEDDENMLWGKMLRFLNLKLYDEAITCVDALREKVRADDEYADAYCAAAVRFINGIGQTGIDYGMMVVGYEPGKPAHEQYQIGDVIIALNGTPCHKYEEYTSLKEALEPDSSRTVVVLRAAEDGSGALEQVELTIPPDAPLVAMRDMTERTYGE